MDYRFLLKKILKALPTLLLFVAIIVEGYYIIVLHDRIKKQTEELKYISIYLQSSRVEKDNLREAVLSARKTMGEKNNGDGSPSQGQY